MTRKTFVFLFSIVFTYITLFSAGALSQGKKTIASAEDMRYGVALYHYYQGDYLEALTELLIAKKRGGIKSFGDNPEIMEGGFSLGFGMERHASDIFERLLSENRSKKSQDAAWFFLSKLRYLRADWQGAEEALERVRNRPAKEIRDEVYAHRINLAIQQNDLEKAEALIKKRRPSADWRPYVYFNMGAAYSRQIKFQDAIRYFNKLTQEEYPTDELRALFDKAMTSSGYVHMMTEDYEEAIKKFSRVRLTSAYSNRALLGYGWAAARLERFKEALKPWHHLANSSLVDENSQEALIAVPYAYEKLGSEGLALEYFQIAEKVFLEERDRLDGVIEGMKGNQLLEALKIERSSGLDWLKHVRENQVTPQLGYLAELFSREEFQGVVQELRDLVGIREDLRQWEDKIVFYSDLIDEREEGRNKKSEDLAAKELALNIKKMKAKRAFLAQKIEQIAAERDFFALANAEEKDLIDRVLRADKNINALRETDPFIDESEEAIRRYRGMLLWDASETFSDRLWRVVKTLNLLDKTLATVTRNHEKVDYLAKNAEDLEPFKVRTRDASGQIEIMLARIDLIVEKTQDDLRKQTADVLSQQRLRLNHYIAQSRLSIARLYDKALQATLAPEADADATEQEEAEVESEEAGQKETDAETNTGDIESNDDTPVSEETVSENTASENTGQNEPALEAPSQDDPSQESAEQEQPASAEQAESEEINSDANTEIDTGVNTEVDNNINNTVEDNQTEATE